MHATTTAIGLLGLTAAATGGVLMDQVGSMDGADVNTANMLATQFFEAAYSVYDIAALDDFDNSSGGGAGTVSCIIGGWNGYVSIDGIQSVHVNFYMAPEDAATNLVGYATGEFSVETDPAWTGTGFGDLLNAAGFFAIGGGTQYVALIPVNEFAVNGQTGAVCTFIGDDNSWQANPGGGFGMPGNMQTQAFNLGIRVLSGSGDPCDLPLGGCPADISGPGGEPDGIVGVDDALGCIGSFGQIGDGTSRPLGDCYPLPTGDCEVTVDDLLTIIAAFGNDCRPRGACCYGLAGCDEDLLEEDCTGDYLGDESSCTDCHAGACCYIDGSCTEGTPNDCEGAGGTYSGDGIDCASANCPQPEPGACCLGPVDCLDNLLPTDCADFGGEFQGNGTNCADSPCGWAGCPDGATDEGVPCQEDTTDPNNDPNGGMNVNPPAFGSIAIGESICGLMSTYTCLGCGDGGADALYRDTDWYLFDNASGGEYTVSGGGEMMLVIGIVDNDALSFVDYFLVDAYGEGEVTVTLPAGGSYAVWVGFNFDGGEQPCSTGANQYSVTLEGQAASAAACCVLTECVGDLDPTDCAALGGTYVSGESCATYSCPGVYAPCSTGVGEDPLDPADSWTAGTSDSGAGYLRAMNVDVASVSDATIYGLSLVYNNGWSDCSGDAGSITLEWSIMDDAAGLPGAEVASGIANSHSVVDLVYAGIYPLSQWGMSPGLSSSADWLQANSTAGGQGECWFLWMSSTPADSGSSALNDGSGWADETFSLNYCITP